MPAPQARAKPAFPIRVRAPTNSHATTPGGNLAVATERVAATHRARLGASGYRDIGSIDRCVARMRASAVSRPTSGSAWATQEKPRCVSFSESEAATLGHLGRRPGGAAWCGALGSSEWWSLETPGYSDAILQTLEIQSGPRQGKKPAARESVASVERRAGDRHSNAAGC